MKFEEEFALTLGKLRIRSESHTDSGTKLDYLVRYGNTGLWFELKEKIKSINTSAWPQTDIPQENLFIIDELTARKIMYYGPLSCVVVRDYVSMLYTYISVVDLWTMPRIRANRPQQTQDGNVFYKGKWLIDLRNGISVKSVAELIHLGKVYSETYYDVLNSRECYGNYVGERVVTGGELRTPAYRAEDLEKTVYTR